jgi:hypothetical protein
MARANIRRSEEERFFDRVTQSAKFLSNCSEVSASNKRRDIFEEDHGGETFGNDSQELRDGGIVAPPCSFIGKSKLVSGD